MFVSPSAATICNAKIERNKLFSTGRRRKKNYPEKKNIAPPTRKSNGCCLIYKLSFFSYTLYRQNVKLYLPWTLFYRRRQKNNHEILSTVGHFLHDNMLVYIRTQYSVVVIRRIGKLFLATPPLFWDQSSSN